MEETYIDKESKKKDSNSPTFIERTKTALTDGITIKPPQCENTYFNIPNTTISKPVPNYAMQEEITGDTYKLEIKDGLAEFLGKKIYANEYGALDSIEIPITSWVFYKNKDEWNNSGKDFNLEKTVQALIEENHIIGIRINGYKINTLKKRINQLTELQELQLSNNALEELPEQVTDLTSLNKLIIYHNGLTNLPKNINRLTSLKVLKLDNNLLKEIPTNINGLENLEELSLSLNQITFLPKEISLLRNLKILNLSFNQIKTLPEEMIYLKELQELNLNNNKIGTAPDCLKNMHCKLHIENNLLTYFSKSILENDRP